MEIASKIKQRAEALKNLEDLETVMKATKQHIKNLDSEILEEATNNMVSELVIDDEKYKFKYDHKIFVKESVSNHSAKVDLYRRLGELGYDEAVFFETAYYPAVALKKVWKELEPETINQFATDGLLYHETIPSITSKKIKGTKE